MQWESCMLFVNHFCFANKEMSGSSKVKDSMVCWGFNVCILYTVAYIRLYNVKSMKNPVHQLSKTDKIFCWCQLWQKCLIPIKQILLMPSAVLYSSNASILLLCKNQLFADGKISIRMIASKSSSQQ